MKAAGLQGQQIRAKMSILRDQYSDLSRQLDSMSRNTQHLKKQHGDALKELQIDIQEKKKRLKEIVQCRKQESGRQPTRKNKPKDSQMECATLEKDEAELRAELKELAKRKRRLNARLQGIGKRGRKIKLLTVLDCHHSVMERRRKRREYYRRYRK